MFQYMSYIYEVYKKKSFSKAAKSLYISQPALSNIVKKVEQELGVILFDRSTSPIKLTAAGDFYIKSIEQIMEIEKNTSKYFSTISSNSNQSVYICCSTFFCFHIMPNLISTFTELNPKISVKLIEVNANDFEECVNSGFADIGITVDPIDKEKFTVQNWIEENLILAVPANFEINKKLKNYALSFEDIKNDVHLSNKYPAVNLSEFKDEPFLFLKKGNDMFDRALTMCNNAGFYPNILMYMDQLQTAYSLAKQGRGIIFIRDTFPKFEEPTDTLYFYRLKDINSKRNVKIFHKNNISESSQIFINYLTSFE